MLERTMYATIGNHSAGQAAIQNRILPDNENDTLGLPEKESICTEVLQDA
jgi:hypothetical protein